jgi:hypothetical protein
MARLNKITKMQVKKAIKTAGQWEGFLAPANVNGMHIDMGWCLGHSTTITSEEMLEELINEFKWHNCNYELGYNVAYWQK